MSSSNMNSIRSRFTIDLQFFKRALKVCGMLLLCNKKYFKSQYKTKIRSLNDIEPNLSFTFVVLSLCFKRIKFIFFTRYIFERVICTLKYLYYRSFTLDHPPSNLFTLDQIFLLFFTLDYPNSFREHINGLKHIGILIPMISPIYIYSHI